jgi:hypothetical protein
MIDAPAKDIPLQKQGGAKYPDQKQARSIHVQSH